MSRTRRAGVLNSLSGEQEPMLIDTHAHLDMDAFAADFEAVLERARQAPLSAVISVGIDIPSSEKAVDLSRAHDWIFASVGLHPHHAMACSAGDLDRLVRLAAAPLVVAWGEIGLDYYRDYCPQDVQEATFLRQLEIARDLGLPVIIHDRDAHEDVLSALRRMGPGERLGVIHCFSGDTDLAMTFIRMGYYISIPGTVTFPKAEQIRAVARQIPLEAMLVETDAPYLAPIPRRGKRNEPAFVRYTALEIALLRGISFDETARVTSQNARVLFELPETL